MSNRREVSCPVCGDVRVIEALKHERPMCKSCAQHARHINARSLPLSVIVRRLAGAVATAQHIATTRSTGGLLWPLRQEVDELEAALAVLADELAAQRLY